MQETMLDRMELSPRWDCVADTVMGGVSEGAVTQQVVDGRPATRLTGHVSLENDGGFLQMAFDLGPDRRGVDLSAWEGVELEIRGDGQSYDLRLRTDDLSRPWQSFRAGFTAPGRWACLRFPFARMEPHRTEARFDPARLRRLGVVAVGRETDVDIAVCAVRLYRAARG